MISSYLQPEVILNFATNKVHSTMCFVNLRSVGLPTVDGNGSLQAGSQRSSQVLMTCPWMLLFVRSVSKSFQHGTIGPLLASKFAALCARSRGKVLSDKKCLAGWLRMYDGLL